MQGRDSTIRLKQTLGDGGSKQHVIRKIDWYLQLQLNKNCNYNRLARKIVIANLGGPVKRRIN